MPVHAPEREITPFTPICKLPSPLRGCNTGSPIARSCHHGEMMLEHPPARYPGTSLHPRASGPHEWDLPTRELSPHQHDAKPTALPDFQHTREQGKKTKQKTPQHIHQLIFNALFTSNVVFDQTVRYTGNTVSLKAPWTTRATKSYSFILR